MTLPIRFFTSSLPSLSTAVMDYSRSEFDCRNRTDAVPGHRALQIGQQAIPCA
jgi:hypothetical protein